jgi:proliferating cell nuclear antigen
MTNCIELKTIQSAAFKIMVEALKELLTDTCIEFDKSGIKIVAMDSSHIVLVHLKLDSSKFEYYFCDKKITIGVNMLNFHKLIKTINSNDTLTLYIDEADHNHLGIKIENSEKNTKTNYKLNLLDLDTPSITIDPVEFNSVITLPSTDFQKIIRDMNNLSDYVEIRNINKQLVFGCKGDFCNQETVISDNDNGVQHIVSKVNDEIVQGFFHLRYLVMFTKCTNLCNTVEMYLKNDYPLIVKYGVASLGDLKLCLAPCNNEIM